MRRALFVAGAIAAVASVATAAPAQAAPVGFAVAITAHTNFGSATNDFESNLPGCENGTVVDVGGGSHFTPWGGTFVGTKTFTCADIEAGFTIRLRARFGPGGSTGNWTLIDASGAYAGIQGSGSLVGILTSETSIDDIYTGTVR